MACAGAPEPPPFPARPAPRPSPIVKLPVPGADPGALWHWGDHALQAALETEIHDLGLGRAVEQEQLALALVDVTELDRPRVAAINGDVMLYAASLPKIAVMLAVFQQAEEGRLVIDSRIRTQLLRMIRQSSNPDSTALMATVGKDYIARVLLSPPYRLYDPAHNGGLWAGKDYAQTGLWQRDPLYNLSHAATPIQVARFFYLLQAGRLVSAAASRDMKQILGNSALNHKFVKGLGAVQPAAAIYRKSGTWRSFHSDGALVERPDGAAYIAVALTDSSAGRDWLSRIIVAMDKLIRPDPRRVIPPRQLPAPSLLSSAGG